MTVLLWCAVTAIGGCGAVARFVVDGAVSARWGGDFPLGTLVVNVGGSVLLGVVTGLGLHHDEALLAGTAAIGSYTTFSTWMLETQRLGEERERGLLVLNVILSLGLGVLAAALGRAIGGAW